MTEPGKTPAAPPGGDVRRVNRWPLAIVAGIMLLTMGVLAMVAVTRVDRDFGEEPDRDQGSGARHNANRVVGGYKSSGVIPAERPPAAGKTVLVEEPPPPPTRTPVKIRTAVKPGETGVFPGLKQNIIGPQTPRLEAEKARQRIAALQAATTVDFRPNIRRAPQRFGPPNGRPAAPVTAGRTTDPIAVYRRRLANLTRLPVPPAGGRPGAAATAAGAGPQRWKLDSRVSPPASPFHLLTGHVVPGVLVSGINSNLPGQVIGQVSRDVYDSARGKFLLIPQGARLFGVYSNDVVYGQARLLVSWQRVIFPDGKTLDLGRMTGADRAGASGFTDQADNHYFRIFGSAVLMSLITAGITLTQPASDNDDDASNKVNNALASSLGQQLGATSANLLTKNLNISPTLTIRAGYRFSIVVTKDIEFDRAYSPFDY